MRGLLTLWADEDVIDASDVGAASTRAPYKRKPKPRAKAKGGKK